MAGAFKDLKVLGIFHEENRFARDSPLEGGVSCELVSKSPIPCYPGKYSELHSAAQCSAG